MFQQIVICFAIGLVGMCYLIGYEQAVMLPVFRAGGANWVAQYRYRWIRQRDSVFTTLWPAAEEAVARGIPMLLCPNRWVLLVVLLLVNIGFMAAHPDRTAIGLHRWLLRYLHGLVVIVVAVATYNLYLCFMLHAMWNMSVTARRWHHDNRDRITIWTEGPLEILTNPGAKPTPKGRWIFRHRHFVYANPRHPRRW